jgi:hypothetical protein
MLDYLKKRSNTITVASSLNSNGDNGNNSSTTAHLTTPSWLSQASPNASTSALLSHISLPSISRHRSTGTVSLLVALLVSSILWLVTPFAGPGVIEDMHAGKGDAQTAINLSMENGNNWAPKWMHPHFQAAKAAPGDAKKQILQENYTEKDGLLYFVARAPQNATSGVGAAYASIYPQRHPILYLIEKGM